MVKQKQYTKKVLEYFKNPKNLGDMKKPDAIGEVGNPSCGDVMKIYIKTGKNIKKQEIIKDIKFETMGCIAAIATSSALTDVAKGMEINKARNLTRQDIAKKLGGLPPVKMHCSNLAVEALHKAIDNLNKK